MSLLPGAMTPVPRTFDPQGLLHSQRAYFASGATRDYGFRRQQLVKLSEAIKKYEPAVLEALQQDCRKPPLESFGSEVLLTLSEVRYVLRHLKGWMRSQRVATPPSQFRATATIAPEPKGVVLIIGPWNYPFQLVLMPLIGAIAAGNCVVLKPSEHAPATSALLARLVAETFAPHYITVVEGGIPENQALLAESWDHLFFTGGTAIGRIVMERAAQHLTPVTLELGGKSPCIVDRTCNLAVTAKRIAWGKFINCGQTCIAPDYVLVDAAIKEPLVAALGQTLQQFYGDSIEHNPDYGRIINRRQFERLIALLPEATGEGVVRFGGRHRGEDLFLEPTLVDGLDGQSQLMADEIFGPILPIVTYQNLEEVLTQVRSRPRPLALYVFSQDRPVQQRLTQELSFGGGCINDTIVHLSSPEIPFGGIGASGMGRYRGKYSFETFSHYKGVFKKALWPDLPWRYPPYPKSLEFLRKLV